MENMITFNPPEIIENRIIFDVIGQSEKAEFLWLEEDDDDDIKVFLKRNNGEGSPHIVVETTLLNDEQEEESLVVFAIDSITEKKFFLFVLLSQRYIDEIGFSVMSDDFADGCVLCAPRSIFNVYSFLKNLGILKIKKE